MICTAVSAELFKCRNQLWFRAFQHLQHSFKTFCFSFSLLLPPHREFEEQKISFPNSFAMPLIFSHYKQIFITQNHIHVYISDFYMHLFLIYKNKRVKIKNFFFRLICSLYIQYLSIYFTSILKIAFDVNPPLPVILAYKFS